MLPLSPASTQPSDGEPTRLSHKLQIGLVCQLLLRRLRTIQRDNIHIGEVGEFSVDRARVLSLLDPDLLPFCEYHAGRVGQDGVTDNPANGGDLLRRAKAALSRPAASD